MRAFEILIYQCVGLKKRLEESLKQLSVQGSSRLGLLTWEIRAVEKSFKNMWEKQFSVKKEDYKNAYSDRLF